MTDLPFLLPEDMAPEARLSALEKALQNCAHALNKGDPRDMNGMDKEVARLCQQVMALPGAEAQAFTPRLSALAESFGALGDATRRVRDVVSGEISQIQARQQAYRAYGMRGAPPKAEGEGEPE